VRIVHAFLFFILFGQAFCKSSIFPSFLPPTSLSIQSFFFTFHMFSPNQFLSRALDDISHTFFVPSSQIELCSLRNFAFCLPIPRLFRLMIFLFSFVLEIRLVQRLNRFSTSSPSPSPYLVRVFCVVVWFSIMLFGFCICSVFHCMHLSFKSCID